MIQITETNFDETLQSSPIPVLLELGATWCQPCQTMKPVLERASRNLANRLVVAQADIDQCKALSKRLCSLSVPTFILFKDGAELARTSGAMPYGQLMSWLAKGGIAPPEGSDESGPEQQDDATWSAFYGDADLKQFYFERVRRLAEAGQLERSRFPRWSQGKGTISAAFNRRQDPRLFARTTGMPESAGVAMEFASIISPEATSALFDAIHPGADLSQVAPRLMLAWLGDSEHLSAAFLGDPETDAVRQDWASTLRMALQGEVVAPSTWTALRQRVQEVGRQLPVEKSIGQSVNRMLMGLCPPPDPDRAGAWLGVLNLHGTYIAYLRPLFDAGFTERDFDLERIRDSLARTAAGGRRGADLSSEELKAIHEHWETEHAEDCARLQVVHETTRQMRGPEHDRIARLLFSILADCPVSAVSVDSR